MTRTWLRKDSPPKPNVPVTQLIAHLSGHRWERLQQVCLPLAILHKVLSKLVGISIPLFFVHFETTLLPIHLQREVNSAFADVAGCQLTSAQIGAYLRSEIRNLKRRRLIPKRTLTDSDHSADENSPMCNYRTPTSPAQVSFQISF